MLDHPLLVRLLFHSDAFQLVIQLGFVHLHPTDIQGSTMPSRLELLAGRDLHLHPLEDGILRAMLAGGHCRGCFSFWLFAKDHNIVVVRSLPPCDLPRSEQNSYFCPLVLGSLSF